MSPRSLPAVLTLAILAVSTGCGNPDEPRNPLPDGKVITLDPEVPVDGDVLVAAIPFDPGSLNPVVAPYALSAMIGDLVQPGLVRRHVEKGELVYEPLLASEFAFSPDKTALTYTLHEGLTWEDETPLTSKDVAFTQELIGDTTVASNWHGDAQHISSIDTPDDRTVVFHFERRQNPTLLQGYTIRGIVPRHALETADRATLRGHVSARSPLASGSYRIAEWRPDSKLVLAPNPRAPAHLKPHLERIVFKVLPEYSTRLMELEMGTVDLVPDIEVTDLPRLHKKRDLELMRMPAASMNYVGYNLTDPRFTDLRVRRALTMAIDRERIIRDYLSVEGTTYGDYCVGTISPSQPGWHAPNIIPLPYDPRAAMELLDAAGWKDVDKNGVRERGDDEMRFRLMVQTGSAETKRLAVLVQAYLEPIGVTAEIEMVEPARFAELAREHQFEAILWSFGANPVVDPSIQWSTGGRYNWYQYSNPEVDALIEKGLSAVDVSEAQEHFREVQRLVHADQPVTFLYWRDAIVGVDRRFRGVEMNNLTLFHHIENWYVPFAEHKYRGMMPFDMPVQTEPEGLRAGDDLPPPPQ
jgi:peptide/nickel transport system substrate-binding protein